MEKFIFLLRKPHIVFSCAHAFQSKCVKYSMLCVRAVYIMPNVVLISRDHVASAIQAAETSVFSPACGSVGVQTRNKSQLQCVFCLFYLWLLCAIY